MQQFICRVLMTLGLLVPLCYPAWAHKVVASAYASGAEIEGEIGFSNGDMAANVLVEIFDEGGKKIGETQTDGDGFFTYRPTARVVHVFRANLGAGHVADFRLEIDDLPQIAGADVSKQAVEPAGQTDANAPAASEPSAISEDQRQLIAEIVHREINPLRREIAAYKEKNDVQSILGGLGYIAGLFGLGFYLAARRKLAKA